NTAGKGWTRERQTPEKTPRPDYLSAGVGDDRSASAAPGDSCSRRTRRHAAPDAARDPSSGYARTESVQFLSLPGMVCGSQKEGATAGRLLYSRSGRRVRGGAKGSFGPSPFLYGRTHCFHQTSPAHGAAPPSVVGDHEHAESGEISLRPHER